jgi:hypothetical protein
MIKALEWVLVDNLIRLIKVFLDAQAAINRLQHTYLGLGQALALRAHNLAKEL